MYRAVRHNGAVTQWCSIKSHICIAISMDALKDVQWSLSILHPSYKLSATKFRNLNYFLCCKTSGSVYSVSYGFVSTCFLKFNFKRHHLIKSLQSSSLTCLCRHFLLVTSQMNRRGVTTAPISSADSPVSPRPKGIECMAFYIYCTPAANEMKIW
jgi:hypothetical protein